MNIILFDNEDRDNLLPLVFAKPIAALRMGAFTFAERYEYLLNTKVSYLTQEYLSTAFPKKISGENLFIDPVFFPTTELIQALKTIQSNEALFKENKLIAFLGSEEDFINKNYTHKNQFDSYIKEIKYSWDLFSYNSEALLFDIELLKNSKQFQEISDQNFIIGDSKNIFIEKGAKLNYAFLNTEKGPIYISKDAEIMEGSMLRGPIFIGENAIINMGAKIYGGTTIGKYCKVGGEINNAIFMEYSNKGHDGFIGNAVIGSWCNLGADTNASNLKNNYTEVKAWNYSSQKFIKTGLQFCGLIMGDHSKTAINTQFNTATTVGFSANIFQAGFPKQLISNFSWYGNNKELTFELEKAIEVAKAVMSRRNVEFTLTDQQIFYYLFEKGRI